MNTIIDFLNTLPDWLIQIGVYLGIIIAIAASSWGLYVACRWIGIR
jgi:hypothetical protein